MISPKRIALLISIFIFSGCQKSIDQYDSSSAPRSEKTVEGPKFQKPFEPTNPDAGKDIDLLEERDLTAEEISQITRENSLKPIVYGEGASGITLKMELREAKDILSPPFYGPDSDGVAAYGEGIVVDWRMNAPRVPEVIVVQTSYTGSLRLPEPYGDIRMQQSVGVFFGSDPLGNDLIRDLYNKLEGADEKFDCLAARKCEVARSPDYFAFVLPKMIIFLSSDNKHNFFRAILREGFSPGKLANDFDLIRGEFLFANEEGVLTGEKIGLGASWGELKEKSEADSHTEVLSSLFLKQVEGVGIGITKSQFDRDYKEPDGAEKVRIANVFGDYNNVRIRGKLVEWIFAPLGLDVELRFVDEKSSPGKSDTDKAVDQAAKAEAKANGEAEEDDSEEEEALLLNTHFPARGNVDAAKIAIRKLADLVSNEIAEELGLSDPKKASEFMTYKRIKGLNKTGPYKTFSAEIGYFSNRKLFGREFRISLSVNSGSLSYVAEDIVDPFASKVLPSRVLPIVVGKDDLGSGGYKLGDTLTITDIDEARNEATLFKGSKESRVGYVADSALAVAYMDTVGKTGESYQNQEVIYSPLGIRIGAHMVQQGRDSNGRLVKLLQVNSLTTEDNQGAVLNVCGIPKFSVRFGAKDSEVESSIQEAVISANARREEVVEKVKANVAAGKSPGDGLTEEDISFFQFRGCKYFKPVDANGTSVTSALYFPEQRMKLFMEDRELVGVTIYNKPEELLKALKSSDSGDSQAAAKGEQNVN
ncbi:MAG: hypothetical protein KDD25_00280 [Bdellovibrionales bacterium]|nr:hypothetical protein [Bdellovibrionales bacterium]